MHPSSASIVTRVSSLSAALLILLGLPRSPHPSSTSILVFQSKTMSQCSFRHLLLLGLPHSPNSSQSEGVEVIQKGDSMDSRNTLNLSSACSKNNNESMQFSSSSQSEGVEVIQRTMDTSMAFMRCSSYAKEKTLNLTLAGSNVLQQCVSDMIRKKKSTRVKKEDTCLLSLL